MSLIYVLPFQNKENLFTKGNIILALLYIYIKFTKTTLFN